MSKERHASLMGRVPLRIRLVAGFAIAMAVLLAAAGAFVYVRVQHALDAALDRELDAAAEAALADLETDASLGAEPPIDMQLIGADGRVIAHTGRLSARPAIGARSRALAARGPIRLNVGGSVVPASPNPMRILAQPAPPTPGSVLVVATRRDQRDEALRELVLQLSLAGLASLALASAVAERLAAAVLGPVERYRRQAAAIAGGDLGRRLAVPERREDEIVRLGHTFNDVLTALEAAIGHERQFVDAASHQLRTPLTLLSTRVQLLRRRAPVGSLSRSSLDELATDVASLVTLTDGLLSLGSLRAGRVPDPRLAGSTDLVSATRAVASTRGLDVAAEAASVMVDVPPEAVQLVVANILDNAMIHGRPPVAVSVRAQGDLAVVAVADHGDGIPPDFRQQATEPFQRGPGVSGRPGHGLGLALVAAAAALFRGTVCIADRAGPGSGALVEVSLPRSPTTAPPSTASRL